MVAVSPLDVVRLWHEALNRNDFPGLLALSTPDIEVGGPRGTGHGAEVLHSWVERAAITLIPTVYYTRGDTVVVNERASWQRAGGSTEPQAVASIFTVYAGRVARVMRYESLAVALQESGLSLADRQEGTAAGR